MKIYSESLGREFDTEILESQNGTVEFEGKKLYLIQQAYANQKYDYIVYRATAIDDEGNDYQVEWDTVEGWEDHKVGEDGFCAVEGCNGFCEDESNACNWDEYTVTKN